MYTVPCRYAYLVFNLVAFKRSCGKMSTRFDKGLAGQVFLSIEPELQAGAQGFGALPRIPAAILPDNKFLYSIQK